MSTTKAIIFDLDGVLIDSLPIHYKSYVKLYSKYGIKYSFDEFITKDITAGAMNVIPRVLKEHGKDNKKIEAILKEGKKGFRRLWKEKNEKTSRMIIQLHSGALPLIKSLKKDGYKLAVASGGTTFFVNHMLRKNKIRKYFSAVVTGENARKKPNPDIFLKAARKLGIPPRNCLVIEDAKDGVTAAKRAKMKVIGHYQPKYRQDLSRADKVVKSMSKINVKMIQKI